MAMHPKPKSLFDKCTNQKLMHDGRLKIRCRRGLWEVSSLDHHFARKEAMRYWELYLFDGEYQQILREE